MSRHDDFDFEASPGLPAPLPAGETLLWQGSPDWRSLAWRAFHGREVAAYFAILIAWRLFSVTWETSTPLQALAGALPTAVAAALALGLIAVFAWLTARASIYSITSRRVVMRIGVALPTTFNLPFASIDAASAALRNKGRGDISLKLAPGNRLAHFILWPHARPWRFSRPEPMLLAIPECGRVADLLAQALRESAGLEAKAAPVLEPATRPRAKPLADPAAPVGASLPGGLSVGSA